MDCRHFHGRLSSEERQFLNQILKYHDGEKILKSWLENKRVKAPAGRVDEEKVETVKILEHH